MPDCKSITEKAEEGSSLLIRLRKAARANAHLFAILAAFIAIVGWAARDGTSELQGQWRVVDFKGARGGIAIGHTVAINAGGALVGESQYYTGVITKPFVGSSDYIMLQPASGLTYQVKTSDNAKTLTIHAPAGDHIELTRLAATP